MFKEKTTRRILAILLLFLAINAFGGGYYGMSGAKDIPLEWLEGSPFRNYFIPALFLFFVIGGLSLTAAIVVFLNKKFAANLAIVAAAVVFLWIIVQLCIIGYVSWMQPVTTGMALLIIWFAYLWKKKRKYF